MAALLLFALALPVMLVAAGTVVALSRRTPFVAHRRVGQHGKSFWMWKLRTMWEPAGGNAKPGLVEYIDNGEVPAGKSPTDERVVSRVAAFYRRHSIDELPQLAHVIAGTMSLVGPRPLTAQELEVYYGPSAGEVLRARPGLTGVWQVRGRSALTYRQRKRYDLFFVRQRSPRLYWWILIRTIREVLSGRNAY